MAATGGVQRVQGVPAMADIPAATTEATRAGTDTVSPNIRMSELAAGAWFVVNSVSGDVFTSEPDLLWRNVLRRQADDLQLVTFYPRDITLN